MAMDYKAIEQKKRTLEAFAYIAARMKAKSNIYNVLKVFYLADKMHMERFGRFIFDDQYAALDKGPVPSKAYNMICQIQAGRRVLEDIESPVAVEGYKVVAVRDFDDDLFSDSDLECIDEVIDISKRKDLGKLSHDGAWGHSRATGHHFMPSEFIIDNLDNASSLKDLVKNRY
ncbi:hypothetical protein PSYAC_04678 [Pseudomonas syringae pv. actinidiae str. M302091]|uniref:type II toxin-antitoxin system antitoxin SocA domain-containing protein n=1 Tax=Pseudomonas syringae TaxID=317 RepID=UPI0002090D0D|nr:type II toxin-antitoxin system antitoxin SocA domain-containing protein [Pseudomonas syringae]EGH64192.1 hypothetical protein PSYAC_04678 [Pseudomonas syringae pv. actinidiae str. M302091]